MNRKPGKFNIVVEQGMTGDQILDAVEKLSEGKTVKLPVWGTLAARIKMAARLLKQWKDEDGKKNL